jgi:hypothetical protein
MRKTAISITVVFVFWLALGLLFAVLWMPPHRTSTAANLTDATGRANAPMTIQGPTTNMSLLPDIDHMAHVVFMRGYGEGYWKGWMDADDRWVKDGTNSMALPNPLIAESNGERMWSNIMKGTP